jgi:hypothetical protein
MSKFYFTENGKPKPYKFKDGEYETYKEVCLTIWGGLPHDVGWAKNTEIYKTALIKYNDSRKKP